MSRARVMQRFDSTLQAYVGRVRGVFDDGLQVLFGGNELALQPLTGAGIGDRKRCLRLGAATWSGPTTTSWPVEFHRASLVHRAPRRDH